MSPHPALHSTLKDELASLELVISILHEEQEILTRARIEQLADISDKKSRAVATLEHHSAERRALMQACDIPDDGSAISAWLASHDPALLETWQTLIELARKAAQYNRSNGRLISSREEANRALMNVLLIEQGIESAYTADGRISHNTSRRPFDRA